MAHYTLEQLDALESVVAFSSALGTCGALFVIMSYLLWPPFRTAALSTMSFRIAVADLVATLAKSIGQLGPRSSTSSVLCQLQASVMQFADLATIFLFFFISLNLFRLSVLKHHLVDLKNWDRVYLYASIGVPLLIAGGPLVALAFKDAQGQAIHVYGEADLWCWISARHQIVRFALFYFPLIFVYVFNVGIFTMFKLTAEKRIREEAWFRGISPKKVGNRLDNFMSRSISYFVMAFIVTWTPSIVSRIYLLFAGKGSFALTVWMGIFSPARGFTNFVVAALHALQEFEIQEVNVREALSAVALLPPGSA